jgi:signal transduction histidine kinase
LAVHDLRNPAAALAANLGFVRDGLAQGTVPASELGEVLAESQQALSELMRGLDQLAWIGRSFGEHPVAAVAAQDLCETFSAVQRRMRFGAVSFRAPERPVLVLGGEALERLIELLVSNGHQHAPGKRVRVSALLEPREREGGDADPAPRVSVEIRDEGRPLAAELHEAAFTLSGQQQLKGRADGRYGRVLALFAAGLLARALGTRVTSGTSEGQHVFRIALQPAEPPPG